MDSARVMIVEDNRECLESLVSYLGSKPDIEVVATATDGREARNRAVQIMPDVIVLDIVMPQYDGFEFMRQLRKEVVTLPKIIVLSSSSRDSMVREATDLGAYFYLVKPCDPELLYAYIRDRDRFVDNPFCTPMPEPKPIDEYAALDALTGAVIGGSLNAKGGRYLLAAVHIASELESLSKRVTKEIYPAVAQLFNTTPSQVERAIRHTIETAWERGDIKASGLFGDGRRPTNGEVIAVLAGKRRVDLEKAKKGGRAIRLRP